MKSNNITKLKKPKKTDLSFNNPYGIDIKMQGIIKAAYKLKQGDTSAPPPDPSKILTTDVNLDDISNPKKPIQATWIGHSTVLIQINGINIITDPVFSNRVSPLPKLIGPARYTKPAISIAKLPKIHYVLISHNHYDHLDKPSVIKIFNKYGNDVRWLIPKNLSKWFLTIGISNITELNWWDALTVADIKFSFVPSIHWSRRGVKDMNKSLWGGWVVESNNKKIWFAGDTAYNEQLFLEIGNRFGGFDLSMIPIGAYSPKWLIKFHCTPEEAVKIFMHTKSKLAFGIHFGTFILSHEPLDEPPLLVKKALAENNLPPNCFQAIRVGDTIHLKID